MKMQYSRAAFEDQEATIVSITDGEKNKPRIMQQQRNIEDGNKTSQNQQENFKCYRHCTYRQTNRQTDILKEKV